MCIYVVPQVEDLPSRIAVDRCSGGGEDSISSFEAVQRHLACHIVRVVKGGVAGER